jgi:hypothetical protein
MILIHTKKYLQFYFIENLSNSFLLLISIKFDSFHQFLKFYFNSLSNNLPVIVIQLFLICCLRLHRFDLNNKDFMRTQKIYCHRE